MSKFLSKEKLGTHPWLKGRVRDDILVFSLEERMEDCVIISHLRELWKVPMSKGT